MKYEKIKYPDGSFFARITDFNDPVIKERINTYEDLWFIGQLKDICDHNGVSASLFIPCLLDAQADRRFDSNESSNLKLICNTINAMNFRFVEIFHPHNPEVVENMIDRCRIVDNSGFISKCISEINIPDSELVLLSTDAGGFKPLMKLADKISYKGEVYAASKSRKFVEGKSKLTQVVEREDFQEKPILIIDDLCVFGGTFIGLANLLRDRNAGPLYLAVSHITVPNPNIALSNYDKIFTSNSKYDEYPLNNIVVYPII